MQGRTTEGKAADAPSGRRIEPDEATSTSREAIDAEPQSLEEVEPRERSRRHRRNPLAEKLCSRPQPARHKRENEGFLEHINEASSPLVRAAGATSATPREKIKECMARSAGGSEGPGPPAAAEETLRAIVRK